MDDRQPAKFTIVTSLNRGINLYPLTQWGSGGESNGFMHGLKVEFKKPQPNQATFQEKGFIPNDDWFFLFDEAEKEVMEDEYIFYGIQYQTSVKLARRRIERILEKLDQSIVGRHPEQLEDNKKEAVEVRRLFYRRDYLKDIKEALERFDEGDQITLEFVFTEWPDMEVARKTDYIKEFEHKLLERSKDNLS